MMQADQDWYHWRGDLKAPGNGTLFDVITYDSIETSAYFEDDEYGISLMIKYSDGYHRALHNPTYWRTK